MSWNYRIVRYPKSGDLALHEVYYDANGKPDGVTQTVTGFIVDADEGVDGLIESLELALADVRKWPVFDPPDGWLAADK